MSGPYAVVGVKAREYAVETTLTTQVQMRQPACESQKSSLVFDDKGRAVMVPRKLAYVTFAGKNYMEERHREGRLEIEGVRVEDTTFAQVMEHAGLAYDNDLIGIVVARWEDGGVTQEDLLACFAKARDLLKAIGITEEPRLYTNSDNDEE